MSYEHKPFIEEWFTARDDNGQIVEDDGYVSSADHEIGHSEVEDTQRPNTIYRAMVLWEPWRRAYWDDELETVRTLDLPSYEHSQAAKIKRLQTAVRELLSSLNSAEFEIYYQDPYGGGFKPRTIETYGLTQEDME